MRACEQVLDAGDNSITSIEYEGALELLVELHSLHLHNNSLTTLPPALGLHPALKHLTLYGNTMRRLRQQILSCGTVAVLEWLRNQLPLE